MRLNNDFKNEVNQEFKEADYIGRRLFVRGIVILLILTVLCSIGGVTYKKWKVDQDRKIFKQSVTYNEGVLDDLAKYRYEMITETDKAAQAAIADLVVSRFANYDDSKIEENDLRKFLNDCRTGKYKVGGEK